MTTERHLSSWNETPTRQAIIGFVEGVAADGPALVPHGGSSLPALRMLVLHDDAQREFDYVTGAETALDEARKRSWTVVSMKHDWSAVFPAPPGPQG